MNSNRRKKTATALELSAITLLCITLIVMFVQYCLLKNSASVSTATTPNHSFLQNNDASAEDDISSPGIVVPEFIGFVSESKQLTPVTAEARRRLISETRPYLLAVFSDISTVMEFSSDTAKIEYIDSLIEKNQNYLYFRFANDLPASSFVPAVGGYTLDSIFHSFNVKDLLIFCTETGEMSGIALDTAGNLTVLSVRDRSSLSFESFGSPDISDGFARFEFASFADRKYPVLTSTVAFVNIAAYTDTGDFTVDNDEEISRVLDTFSFNPNSTSFYRTHDALTYVEQAGELSFAHDGSITYSSSGEGIALGKLLNDSKPVFSFEDKVIAARNIIGSLDKDFFGGYASLCLHSVSYSDGLLTLNFAYMADGILIENTKGFATLVFDDTTLAYADIKAKSYAKLDSTYTDIPQKLLFAFSSRNFDASNPPAGFPTTYTEGENSVYVVRSAILLRDSQKTDNGKEDKR